VRLLPVSEVFKRPRAGNHLQPGVREGGDLRSLTASKRAFAHHGQMRWENWDSFS